MKKRIVSGILLTLFLIGMSSLAFNIQPVRASGTIYIRADGSIEGTTDITTVDNATYTFTNNIYDEIVVERDNVVVDGAGHTLQGTGDGVGISLFFAGNVTIRNTEITEFDYGIEFWQPSNHNTISGNNITNNAIGIWSRLEHTINNTISGNNIINNGNGIRFEGSGNIVSGNHIENCSTGIMLSHYLSSNNIVSGNHIANNNYGIWFQEYPLNNIFYHNNFVNNTYQIIWCEMVNVWDDGYPSGGNYWSDYTGVDLNNGPYQNESGSDGIGDTPYVANGANDRYPLKAPINIFDAGTWGETTYQVDTVSNSTVSDFQFSEAEKLISFTVTGTDDTVGFCRATIPNALLGGPYVVSINDSPPITISEWTNDTQTFLYFTYAHSTKTVEIIGTTAIPELSSWISMLLVFIVLAVAIAIYKRRLLKTHTH